jgi:glyoxylase I family protein
MPEIIGIDHIYIAVTDMARAEQFYDGLFAVLGFRKQVFELESEPHIHYYNRHFGYVLRPARSKTCHDPYAPGLHHLCLRVEDEADVKEAAHQLQAKGIQASAPRLYSEYAADYFSTYFRDPDGLQLEITNYRAERRARHDHWDEVET